MCSLLDYSGESIPAEKQVRDKVVSGVINLNGLLKIKVTQIGEYTALAKMIRLIEEAQATKTPIQRTADRIAEVFVPVVIGLACMTFIVWSFWSGDYGGAL
ncbi:MAG: hypothetical protein WD469_10440 [Paenibacillaceae bacterium]